MTQAVANRYVTALAEVLLRPGSALTPEAALEQLESFGTVLAASTDLDNVLRTPVVSPRAKRELVGEISDRVGLDRIVRNFLWVVVDNHRIGQFGLLLNGFRAWLDELRNRVEVEVRVAGDIDGHQKAALERRFRELTGRDVRATYVVDPRLLGGSSVQVGSLLYDGSLRSSLRALASEMGSANR